MGLRRDVVGMGGYGVEGMFSLECHESECSAAFTSMSDGVLCISRDRKDVRFRFSAMSD